MLKLWNIMLLILLIIRNIKKKRRIKRKLRRTNIYQTIIPRNVRLGEAPSYGLPINLYDPASKGAVAYSLLADEVIEREA